jgi:hypothetical protein
LVLASAYSLIAVVLMGDGDLWWGGGLDLLLFIIGVSGAYHRLPAIAHRRSAWRLAGATAGIAVVLYATAAALLWPLHRAWGSEQYEHGIALPGDRPGRNPAFELQHTVSVNAPPANVDTGPIGAQCEPGDTPEILGKETAFTSSACGGLQTSIDDDFFALDVTTPRTLTLRIGADADAVARLTTPDGKVIVVSSAASGNVASDPS